MNKVAIKLLLLNVSLIFSSDVSPQQSWLTKMMDNVGQSAVIHTLSNVVHAKINGVTYGNEPASQMIEYTK